MAPVLEDPPPGRGHLRAAGGGSWVSQIAGSAVVVCIWEKGAAK
jgi:hypothetical protein